MPPKPSRPQRQAPHRAKGLILCFLFFNLALFGYLHNHHRITKLRYDLPRIENEVRIIDEQIAALQFELAKLESPTRCQQLLADPLYSHLRPPKRSEVVHL